MGRRVWEEILYTKPFMHSLSSDETAQWCEVSNSPLNWGYLGLGQYWIVMILAVNRQNGHLGFRLWCRVTGGGGGLGKQQSPDPRGAAFQETRKTAFLARPKNWKNVQLEN